MANQQAEKRLGGSRLAGVSSGHQVTVAGINHKPGCQLTVGNAAADQLLGGGDDLDGFVRPQVGEEGPGQGAAIQIRRVEGRPRFSCGIGEQISQQQRRHDQSQQRCPVPTHQLDLFAGYAQQRHE
ncbi:hypothetical protein D3C75_932020 [compost metagenome]